MLQAERMADFMQEDVIAVAAGRIVAARCGGIDPDIAGGIAVDGGRIIGPGFGSRRQVGLPEADLCL